MSSLRVMSVCGKQNDRRIRRRKKALSDLQTGSRADFEFVSTANAPRAEKNIFVDKVVSEYP